MNRIRSNWFQKNAQQGVFMKISALPTIAASGPVQVMAEKARPKTQKEKYFVVGQTIVGGEEVVGG